MLDKVSTFQKFETFGKLGRLFIYHLKQFFNQYYNPSKTSLSWVNLCL